MGKGRKPHEAAKKFWFQGDLNPEFPVQAVFRCTEIPGSCSKNRPVCGRLTRATWQWDQLQKQNQAVCRIALKSRLSCLRLSCLLIKVKKTLDVMKAWLSSLLTDARVKDKVARGNDDYTNATRTNFQIVCYCTPLKRAGKRQYLILNRKCLCMLPSRLRSNQICTF